MVEEEDRSEHLWSAAALIYFVLMQFSSEPPIAVTFPKIVFFPPRGDPIQPKHTRALS